MNFPLLIGSVVGVLVLAWAAWMLGLGGASIADEAEARRLAEESDIAFTATQAWVSVDHKSALVRSADRNWMLLKVHGAQIAARPLRALEVKRAGEDLIVAVGERMFGDIRMLLSEEDRQIVLALLDAEA